MEVTPTIRTSPPKARREVPEPRELPDPTQSRKLLIAKVVREVATSQRWADFPDMKDALRKRLAALRIPYQPSEFDDAISLVQSNIRLVSDTLERKPARRSERPDDARPLNRFEAADILRRVYAAMGRR